MNHVVPCARATRRGMITLAVLTAAMTWCAGLRADGLPDTVIPNSCGVQLKANNERAADLDLVRDVGFKVVRRGFIWASVERKPGEYDFSSYDRFVKDCRERGIRIIGCIAFGNPLYGGTVLTDEGRAGYARFAAELARRYKDDNIIWEIWNEPNVRTFWGKHGVHNSEQYADEYVALVQAAVPAMKKANPACYVMGGAVSNVWGPSYKWCEFCFNKGILKTGIDAWSLHPYGTRNPEDYLIAYGIVRDLLIKSGGPADFPFVNSERGYPVKKAEGYTGGVDTMQADYQAWHFVRQYMIDLLAGVRITSWYELGGTEGFALIDSKGEPGLALKACKVMIDELRGCRFEKRIPLASDRDFALQFTNPQGGTKLVLWTAPPISGTPDEIKPHAVDIAVAAEGTLATTQIYGEKGQLSAANGQLRVMLTGAPQYVTLKN